MLWIINFIQKRPSDTTIKGARIAFGLILIWVLYYNLIFLGKNIDNTFLDFSIFGYVLSHWFILEGTKLLAIKYAMVAIGIVPVLMGISNICLLKKNHMRIVQGVFSFVLFYIAGVAPTSPSLDFDTLIGLMAILPLFAAITGKCITSNCLKYKEKITKIRV